MCSATVKLRSEEIADQPEPTSSALLSGRRTSSESGETLKRLPLQRLSCQEAVRVLHRGFAYPAKNVSSKKWQKIQDAIQVGMDERGAPAKRRREGDATYVDIASRKERPDPMDWHATDVGISG